MVIPLLVLSGIFFAAWPHPMREAGLSSSAALLMYGLAATVGGILWVTTARTWPELHGRALELGFAAGSLNALGCVAFAYVFTRATRAKLARDIMVLLVIQVALNAAWAAYQAGTVSWRLAIGSATALITILLLR